MRTINSVRNPSWADPTGTRINVEVDFDELDEVFVPFTAYVSDTEPHSVEIFNKAVAGEYGEVAAFVTPSPKTGDEAMDRVRSKRNELLAETDFVENPTYWSRLAPEKQSEWTAYRNALRDITSTLVNPEYTCVCEVMDSNPHDYSIRWVENFQWPTKPA